MTRLFLEALLCVTLGYVAQAVNDSSPSPPVPPAFVQLAFVVGWGCVAWGIAEITLATAKSAWSRYSHWRDRPSLLLKATRSPGLSFPNSNRRADYLHVAAINRSTRPIVGDATNAFPEMRVLRSDGSEVCHVPAKWRANPYNYGVEPRVTIPAGRQPQEFDVAFRWQGEADAYVTNMQAGTLYQDGRNPEWVLIEGTYSVEVLVAYDGGKRREKFNFVNGADELQWS